MNGSCAACVLSCAHSAAFHSSEARTTRSSETSSAAIAAEIGLAVNAAADDDDGDDDDDADDDGDDDEGEKANVAEAEAGDAFGRSSELEATIDRPISVKINDKKACSGADSDDDDPVCCIASTYESGV